MKHLLAGTPPHSHNYRNNYIYSTRTHPLFFLHFCPPLSCQQQRTKTSMTLWYTYSLITQQTPYFDPTTGITLQVARAFSTNSSDSNPADKIGDSQYVEKPQIQRTHCPDQERHGHRTRVDNVQGPPILPEMSSKKEVGEATKHLVTPLTRIYPYRKGASPMLVSLGRQVYSSSK